MDKRQARQDYYKKINQTDSQSNSGIQTWSRFTPVTDEDCYQLGFVYGANNRDFDEGDNIAQKARFILGMQAFHRGYIAGRNNHRPFNDNGEIVTPNY